jgi:hypothetical protein
MSISKYYYKSLADLIPMIEKLDIDNHALTEKLKQAHEQLQLQGRILRRERKDNARYRKAIHELRSELGLKTYPDQQDTTNV